MKAELSCCFNCFTVNWWLPRSSLRMMPSISAWQRVNRALCFPWLDLLLSCLRTGPVHQEISMQRLSQALLSYWPGRDHSTMQTKSLPTPSIIWKQKVRPRKFICFFLSSKKSHELVWTWRDESVKRGRMTVTHTTLTCDQLSLAEDHLLLHRAEVKEVSEWQLHLNNNRLSQPIVHSQAHSACS